MNGQPKTCDYYGICGGCKLYELSYDNQLKIKIENALSKCPSLEGTLKPIIPSPELYHYRNKVEFTFHTKEDLSIGLGFHQKGQFNKFVDITECLLSPESNRTILHITRTWANEYGISAYNKKTHKGILRYLIIRDSWKDQKKLFILVTDGGDRNLFMPLAEKLQTVFPMAGFIWSNQPEFADAVLLNHQETILGDSFYYDAIGGLTYKIPANSFFQANTQAAKILYDTIYELVPENTKVLDLFCGAGTISAYIADKVDSVFGIEIVENAIISAYENCKLNKIHNCEFKAGRARARLAEMVGKETYDIVILDPPRSGTDKKTLNRVAALSPKQIIYVACGLGELAYNLRILEDNGYKIESTQPIDMFPHTPHVELVINLTHSSFFS